MGFHRCGPSCAALSSYSCHSDSLDGLIHCRAAEARRLSTADSRLPGVERGDERGFRYSKPAARDGLLVAVMKIFS